MKNPLLKHVQDVQDQTVRLCGVLRAIDFLDNEGECNDGKTALIGIAKEVADDIGAALDSANLPDADT